MKREALEFFYSDVIGGRRFWGGYARFFEPHIPDRIGGPLLSSVRSALLGDVVAKEKAITILSSSHSKRVSHLNGAEPYNVLCIPTRAALRAIELLNSFKGPESMDTFEIGDWVAFRDTTTGNIYLVTGLCMGNCVNLLGRRREVDERMLKIVQKNNRPANLIAETHQ